RIAAAKDTRGWCTRGGRNSRSRMTRTTSCSGSRRGPARSPAGEAGPTRRGSAPGRDRSRVGRALDALAVLALELEGRVLDVEIAGETAAERVEDGRGVGVPVDDDVR